MSVDRLITLELSRLNAHLPEKRMSLREALSSHKPQVSTKNGGVYTFKREELEFLARILPQDSWDNLMLPILISLVPKLGRGAAKIDGEAEVKVAGHLLGKEKAGHELVIYRPEVAVLRRRLPTTTQYLFLW